MTKEEELAFLSETFRVFPSLQDYSLQKPDIVNVWLEVLEGDSANYEVSYSEAIGVLARWKFGTLPNPPTGYMRELFATHVRAVVGMDRAKANEFNHREAERKDMLEKIERRKAGNPAYKLCRPLFERCLKVNEEVINGRLSRKEADWQIHDIVNELDAIQKTEEVKP